MTSYHWLTGGGTVAWPTSLTATFVNLSLPLHYTLHRIQLRDVSIQGFGAGTTNTSMTPAVMQQRVQFASGAYNGRIIYESKKAVPWNVTVFLATAIPAYNSFYNGGDVEMGFNQRCSYGGATTPAATLQFEWYPIFTGGAGNWSITMNYQFAALYSIP